MLDFSIDRQKLEADKDRVVRAHLGAATRAVKSATKDLERKLEAAVRNAVGGRLWRAWKSNVFPRTGIARDPAGSVLVSGPRAVGAMSFFSEPGRIRSKSGKYLAISTAAAGSRGSKRLLTPEAWMERTGYRLRFVYRRGRPSLLVLDEARMSGKRQVARVIGGKRQGPGRGATVVIFVLLPFVDFANRVALDPIVQRAADDLVEAYQREVGRIG